MRGRRKLWMVVWDEHPDQRDRPESKASAYRYVHTHAANYRQGKNPYVTVYVDERDGQGWQTYEVIDLRMWGS